MTPQFLGADSTTRRSTFAEMFVEALVTYWHRAWSSWSNAFSLRA